MPRDSEHPERPAPSDYAFLEGRILRIESEQKSIRRVHEGLSEQVESLTQSLRRLREENERGDSWRETTDVRNRRRVEIDSLRARARDADDAETQLHLEKAGAWRRLALLAPALGALLYGLAELVRSFVHH